MAEKFKEQAVIISQEEIAPAIYSLWIKTDKIAQYAKAGQFISIYCEDGSRLLPRPISICEIDKEDCALHLVYRIAGAGTEEFSQKQTGDHLSVMGPLGNGFPLKSKKAFLIGGGIGIPPMLELAKQLNCENRSSSVTATAICSFWMSSKTGGSIYCHRGWQCGIKRKCPGCDPGE